MLKVDKLEILVKLDEENCQALDLERSTIVTTPDGERKLLVELKAQTYLLTGRGKPPGIIKL